MLNKKTVDDINVKGQYLERLQNDPLYSAAIETNLQDEGKAAQTPSSRLRRAEIEVLKMCIRDSRYRWRRFFL